MAVLRYILLAAAITLTLALLRICAFPRAHPFPGARAAAAGLASRF